MNDKNERELNTAVKQVFGDVKKGTECRICGRNVTDGRSKYCSGFCSNLADAVMSMLNWSSVRRRILNRDDETCQRCGFQYEWIRRGNAHIKEIIHEKLPERPTSPPLSDYDDWDQDEFDDHMEAFQQWSDQRDELKERYGDYNSYDRRLEVDHILPISEGGPRFDPANLQTLCRECHQKKTSREASARAERQTPNASDLNESILKYVTNGGEES